MVGQAAPLGTSSFDVFINPKAIGRPKYFPDKQNVAMDEMFHDEQHEMNRDSHILSTSLDHLSIGTPMTGATPNYIRSPNMTLSLDHSGTNLNIPSGSFTPYVDDHMPNSPAYSQIS